MPAELTTQQSIDSILQGGITYFQNAAWRNALACFDRVAAARPGSAEIHNYRARAFESLGQYEDALQCLERALTINPSSAADLRNRGIVLRKLGRLSEALDSYNAALAVRPTDPELMVKQAL